MSLGSITKAVSEWPDGKRIVSAFVVAVLSVAVLMSPAAFDAASAQEDTTPTPLERVSALVQPSITYLETTWSGQVFTRFSNGLQSLGEYSSTSRCSGFIVNPSGYIATAGHCVEYDRGTTEAGILNAAWRDLPLRRIFGNFQTFAAFSRVVGSESRRPDREVNVAYGVAASGLRTGQAYPARVAGVRAFDQGDAALLKIEAEDLPALDLASEADYGVGTEIVSVGYPGSVDLVSDATFDPSFKEGSISSQRTVSNGLLPVYEISAAVSPGMSGGPTVDLQGRVIGINSFGIRGEPQAFNFIAPTSVLDELLADRGVQNQVGELNTTYREGLRAFWAGDRTTALARFDEVLGLVPSHELAQDFRRQALRLPASSGDDSGGIPGWVFIALAAAVGVAGALAFARVSRSRRVAPAPAAPAPSPSFGSPAPTPRPNPQPRPSASPPARPSVRRASPTIAARHSSLALAIETGSKAGQRIEVPGPLVVGRSEGDFQIDDPEMSRRHAAIRPAGAHLEIEDLGSSNGTVVNGTPIRKATPLRGGDVVVLGSTRFKVEGGRAQQTIVRTAMSPAALVVRSGKDSGRRYEVHGELTIGRDHTDVVLEDEQVSRRHAAVRAHNDTLEIRDLSSSNGTMVDGSRITEPTTLRGGETIVIGSTHFEVSLGRQDSGQTEPSQTIS